MNLETPQVFVSENELKVTLPLTKPTGKIRIKERSFFGDYGLPVAGRKQKLGLTNYVEWQIGYDLPVIEPKKTKVSNKSKTSLRELTFKSYKNDLKYVYESSEILYYSVKRRLLSFKQIEAAYAKIKNVSEPDTLEMREDMAVCRTNPQPAKVNGVDFFRMTVKYPMLVHKFGKYDIYAEVAIKEKQKAVGTQAMLYVCLPITSLRFRKNIIGRTLDLNETADWVVGKKEAALSLEVFRILGMLSPKHRFDALAILETLFPDLKAGASYPHTHK